MKMSRCALPALLVLILAIVGCGGGGSGSAGRSIDGVVVNERGQPVPGAEVSLLTEGRSHLDAAVTTTTSVDGSFHLTDVPAGDYTLSISLDGPNGVFVDVQVFVSVPEGSDIDIEIRIDVTGTSSGIDLIDPESGVIAGFVFDDHHDFVEDARVTAIHLPSGEERRVTTDDDGFFVIDELRSGPWRISARRGDLRSRPTVLFVRPDSVVQTDLFLFRPERPFNDGPGKGKGKGHLKGIGKGHGHGHGNGHDKD